MFNFVYFRGIYFGAYLRLEEEGRLTPGYLRKGVRVIKVFGMDVKDLMSDYSVWLTVPGRPYVQL